MKTQNQTLQHTATEEQALRNAPSEVNPLNPSGKSEVFGAKRYKKLSLQQDKSSSIKPMYHIYDVIDDAQTKGLLKQIE